MFRDEFVVRDIDQQLLLQEMLAEPAGKTGQEFDSGRRDGRLGDEDASVVVLRVDEVVERAHLLGTNAVDVGAELDVDAAAFRREFDFRVGRVGTVFFVHIIGRTSGDAHLVPAVFGRNGQPRAICNKEAGTIKSHTRGNQEHQSIAFGNR